MILTDRDINEDMIRPFNEKSLTPNGYDLSVGDVKRISGVNGGFLKAENVWYIPANSTQTILTKETITLPPFLGAKLYLRSSLANKGLRANFGYIDAGFSGKLRLAVSNTGSYGITIPADDARIAQIVFEELKGIPKKLYAERSGNFQHVKEL